MNIRTFGYDPQGRLLQVSEGGAEVGQYALRWVEPSVVQDRRDGQARCSLSAMLGEGGQINDLMPDAGEAFSGLGNRIIAEADASGVTKREYIWVGNIAVGVVDAADTASPSLYFVQNDHIGRPVRMRDSSQNDVWYANYRLFGQAITAGSANLDMRLPGQWFQMETGLSWNWRVPTIRALAATCSRIRLD